MAGKHKSNFHFNDMIGLSHLMQSAINAVKFQTRQHLSVILLEIMASLLACVEEMKEIYKNIYQLKHHRSIAEARRQYYYCFKNTEEQQWSSQQLTINFFVSTAFDDDVTKISNPLSF